MRSFRRNPLRQHRAWSVVRTSAARFPPRAWLRCAISSPGTFHPHLPPSLTCFVPSSTPEQAATKRSSRVPEQFGPDMEKSNAYHLHFIPVLTEAFRALGGTDLDEPANSIPAILERKSSSKPPMATNLQPLPLLTTENRSRIVQFKLAP